MALHVVSSPAVERVLSKLDGVEERGTDKWRALCPVHKDHKPSLDVDLGTDGRALVTCRAHCDTKDVLRAIGLTMSDLFADKPTNGATPMHAPPKREPKPKAKADADDPRYWPIAKTYDYVDADGTLVLQACRKEPKIQRAGEKPRKTFTQRQKGVGEWIYNLDGIDERPMYRLPDLLEDLAHERAILLVEGEKCCDAARGLGFAATTHIGGSNGWRPEYARQLAGANVVIMPDNDEPSRKWAAEAGAALLGVGARVRMLALPVTELHADIVDWIAAGGTVPQLERFVDRARPWAEGDPVPVPLAPPKFRLLSVRDLEAMPPMEWLVGEEHAGVFPTGALVAIFGAPGAGKSFVAADLACTIASRRTDLVSLWLGNTVQHGPVLYVAAEGGRGFRHRILAWRKHYKIAEDELALSFVLEPVNLFGGEDISHILRTADLLPEPPSLVVFDTLARSMVGGDENSAQDMGLVIDRADRIKRELGATVSLVHHSRRDVDAERGSGAFRGGLDTLCLVREDEDNGRVLSCEKQKDADPFDPITFFLATVGDSCVVSAQAPSGTPALNPSQRAALKTLADLFPKGATATEWLRSSGVPDRTFYRVKARLVSNGYVMELDRGNSTRYTIQASGHWALNGHVT